MEYLEAFKVVTMRKTVFKLAVILSLILSACQNENNSLKNSTKKDGPLFTQLSSAKTGITFSNVIKEDENRNPTLYDYYYNGSGLSVGDINNDGLVDVFFAGNNVSNRLYLNKGNFKFEDITEKAGIKSAYWSTGVTMVDINKDGYLDIYVCNSAFDKKASRVNHLYINNGNNSFTEKASQYGIADTGNSSQASFFDYDKDGDLDLFVMNHSIFQTMSKWLKKMRAMAPNDRRDHTPALYRNNGNNTFTDISQQAGIINPAFGLGLITADLDDDGLVDVYVSNDYFLPDNMFLNAGNGTFTDEIKNKTTHISYYSMGADAADFNNDGLLDISVVDMTPDDHIRNKVLMASMNVDLFKYLTEQMGFHSQYMFNALHVNQGQGFFSEIGLAAGISKTDWSWSTLFADFDNDGLKDNLITNGFRKDTKNNDWRKELDEIIANTPKEHLKRKRFEHLSKAASTPTTNYLYKNLGNYQFEDKTKDWGFTEASFSNGAAYADFDNDGDLDIMINNIDKEAFVFRNNAIAQNNNNFIRFNLYDKTGKRPAYNSKVTIYYGDELQFAELNPVKGYLSSVESTLHFGLGKVTSIDSVKIKWLNGGYTTLNNLASNKTHNIFFNKTHKKPQSKKQHNSLFTNLPKPPIQPEFVHHENDYDDFKTEILLPHRQSMLGPFISVGDVNGDQLEDFFIGGAKGQSGQLYFQKKDNSFTLAPSQAWVREKDCEDMGSIFFDSDNDGDLDLYISSGGGGAFAIDDPKLQNRLYINDGKGRFTKATNALPKILISSGQVKSADYDNDGDQDLLVAGRTTPGKYPFPTDSYLLNNDKGIFKDVTDEVAPGLRQLGMVTDIIWTDIDLDQQLDIVAVGEWMPITCFKNMGDKFENYSKQFGLNKKTGWWKRIIAEDFDQDGDQDFIVGNIGTNNKFQPTTEKPLHIFCNDFDDNGTLDIVLSKKYKNNLVPVRGKECSTQQMPFVSEKFPTFKAFSESSLSEIYGSDKLATSLQYSANYFKSVYIENKGDGKFEFRDLPTEAQFAPVNTILAKDFDRDGVLDILLAGNDFQTEVETPRYDAGKGLFLKGNGDGTFKTSLQLKNSGIMLPFDTKDFKLIQLGNGQKEMILVANNNNKIQCLIVK